MRSLVPLVVAALLLAGCAGDAPTAEQLDSGAVAADPLGAAATDVPLGTLDAAASAAPAWAVGDAWDVTTHNGDVEERATLVVTRADKNNYFLETTSEQMAGFDAMLDVSYLGNIRASDLAGYQAGQPIQYFDFPLAHGKTWTTTWDGLTIALTATAKPTGFGIVGLTEDGTVYVEYDYAPAMRWWSHIEFVADGYGLRVDRATSNWTGALSNAVASVVYEAGPTAPVASPNSGSFTIDEGQTFGMVVLIGGGSAWARGFALTEPGGAPYMSTSATTFETADVAGSPYGFAYFEQIPPTAGEWHIAAPTFHHPDGGAFVTVYQVAVAPKQFP